MELGSKKSLASTYDITRYIYMFYSNLKVGFCGVRSLIHCCVINMICFRAWVKGYCRFPACKLG